MVKNAAEGNLTTRPKREGIASLRARLEEAEETLRAIREGEVDAVVISGRGGERVFSLAGSETVYRLIFQTMSDAALTVSLEGRILFCNARFAEFVKTPLEKILGRRLLDFTPTNQQDAAMQMIRQSRMGMVKGRLVFQGSGADPVPVHLSASPLLHGGSMSICIVATNLTELESSAKALFRERRRAKESDRLQAAQHATMLATTPDGFWVLDADGRLLDVNDAYSRMSGYSRDELLRMSIADLDAHETSTNSVRRIHELKGNGFDRFESLHRKKDGSTINVEISASLWRATGLYLLFVRDITERKWAEAELIKYRDHLEELVRRRTEDLARSNRDLEQFAYAASHDLQEPLRTISGFLKLLEQRYADQLDSKAREYVDHSLEGAARMSHLIRDLLEYSRLGQKDGAQGPTDANRAVAAALEILRDSIRESGSEVTHDSLPVVSVDLSRLTQVFQNLIGNAIKFRKTGQPCRIHVGAVQGRGEWIFSVRDNGIGIDREQQERIFVIFQRLHTRREYPGTGIGLAMCKRIVERQGGRIWVESAPGEGSTFFFTLPRATDSAGEKTL